MDDYEALIEKRQEKYAAIIADAKKEAADIKTPAAKMIVLSILFVILLYCVAFLAGVSIAIGQYAYNLVTL